MKAFDEFTDTPAVDEFVRSSVHSQLQSILRQRLEQSDQELGKKNPRTRFAIDSFSGYCLLRSEPFRIRLAQSLDRPLCP